MSDKESILQALNSISPSELDYTEWLNVGMALKAEGFDCDTWDDWSKNDNRYHSGDCEKKWSTFTGSGITAGTIVKLAKDHGFCIQKSNFLDFDDIIDCDEKTAYCWNRKADIVAYLNALYKPDDKVMLVTSDVYQDDSGSWKPGKGVSKVVGDILSQLEKTDVIENVIYDTEAECGAWITANPIDGEGRKNDNVVAFKYALVESDTMSLSDQEKFLRASKLPIATLVMSGGKSIHALVKVDAKTKEEYAKRVDILYTWLAEQGIEIDKQNKNPSRLTRLPGVYRKGKEQRLLDVNIGLASWDSWQASLIKSSLPDIIHSADFVGKPVKLAPVLIDGILRQGHKGVISGESKSGKSWALVQLAWAVATGGKWFDEYQCAKGNVLYINAEIDDNSFMDRVNQVWDKMATSDMAGFYILNLRGRTKPMEELVPGLVDICKGIPNLRLIIVDPIYKLNTADENNAGEMSHFCNQFDILCEKTGASTFFCHHYAKGAQGGKKAMDRASGSGVLARDPDAILALTKLASNDDDDGVPLRLEAVLREFKEPKPLNMWFRYPIHVKDTDDILTTRHIEGSTADNLDKSSKRSRSDDDKRTIFINAFESATKDGCTARLSEMETAAAALGTKVKERTLREYYNSYLKDEYEIKSGTVIKNTCR